MKTHHKIFFLCIFSFSFFRLEAYTEKNYLQKAADMPTLRSSLLMNRSWVPYPGYADRKRWDDLLKDNKQYFIQNGERRLDYEWKVIPATAYIEFERSGNRRVMQNPFESNNNALAALFMAELAEGKGRFIDQLINGVFHSCEMTSWALSAHLGSAQVSRHSLPDNKRHVIDLAVGDLGSMLAWIYYYFKDEFDKVNPVISERLRTELQERVLDAYMDNTYWWMAANYKPGVTVNNWNPWCNFNVLQTYFLLENDREKLAEAVYKTMISVDKFINYTHEDGACEEGPSYWGHAAGKMYDYLQMLYDGTGGTISLFDKPMIKAMGEYIVYSDIGNGWVVNFADASAKGGGGGPLIYRYGKAVGSQAMMQYAACLNNRVQRNSLMSGRDIFRTLQNLLYWDEMNRETPAYQPPAYTWYPETEFCYMTNEAGFFLATKAGYNKESHNHNDVGTFSLYINGTPVFIDAGVGTYTRQTFSSERYSIWTMQSEYHNLPVINGVPQAFGQKYKATDVSFNARAKSFSANIAPAYSGNAQVKRWIRHYTLEKKSLKIQDTYSLEKAVNPNRINFLTWGNVDISRPGEVIVEVNKEKVCLSYDKNNFDVTIEAILLDDSRLSNVWGKEIYRVSLQAKRTSLSGTYTYRVQQVK